MKRRFLAVLGLSVTLVTVPVHSAMAADICTDPQPASVSVPGPLYAGDQVSGTVSLTCAPASAVTLSLSSDNSRLTVPATVKVARRRTSAKVTVKTSKERGGQYVANVTAAYAGRSASGAVTVSPGLQAIDLPLSSKPNTVDPDITFTGPAPAGGVTVRLASDNPAVTVPATAFFQEGAYGGDVGGVTVHPVRGRPPSISRSRSAPVRSAARPSCSRRSTAPAVCRSSPSGKETCIGLDSYLQYTIRLSNPAPDNGLNISLRVRDADSGVHLQQDTVEVLPGWGDTAFYLDADDVTRTVHTAIEATAGGVTTSIPVTVQPRLTAITGMPASVKSGSSFQGTGRSTWPRRPTPTSPWTSSRAGESSTYPARWSSRRIYVRHVHRDDRAGRRAVGRVHHRLARRTTIYSDPVTLTP